MVYYLSQATTLITAKHSMASQAKSIYICLSIYVADMSVRAEKRENNKLNLKDDINRTNHDENVLEEKEEMSKRIKTSAPKKPIDILHSNLPFLSRP